MGYFLAGFDVIGVDINPQPDYPFRFIQADVLTARIPWHKVQAVHASPPCQTHSVTKNNHRAGADGRRRTHLDCLPETREMLTASGLPYVIENVPQAPMINPIMLCGSMFNLETKNFELRRHRMFEGNWDLPTPPRHRCGRKISMSLVGHTGAYYYKGGCFHVTRQQGMQLMGMPWITANGRLTQSIPPAYTAYMGYYLKREL